MNHIIRIIIFIGICALCFSACTKNELNFLEEKTSDSCPIRDIFTHRWFDYYERGLSCVDRKLYKKALNDLKLLLKAVKGTKCFNQPLLLQ